MARLNKKQWTQLVSDGARDKAVLDQLKAAADNGGGEVEGITIGKADVADLKKMLVELSRFVGGKKLEAVDAAAWAMGILHHSTVPKPPGT